jgi:hypothetical protein
MAFWEEPIPNQPRPIVLTEANRTKLDLGRARRRQRGPATPLSSSVGCAQRFAEEGGQGCTSGAVRPAADGDRPDGAQVVGPTIQTPGTGLSTGKTAI